MPTAPADHVVSINGEECISVHFTLVLMRRQTATEGKHLGVGWKVLCVVYEQQLCTTSERDIAQRLVVIF